MELFYNGKVIYQVVTNQSMTVEEVLYSIGYDVNSQEDLEKAYKNDEPWVYLDDDGSYSWEFDKLTVK